MVGRLRRMPITCSGIIPTMSVQNFMVHSKRLQIPQIALVAVLAIAPFLIAQQRAKPQPPKSVRLYVFDCGSLDIPDTSPYQLKKEELASSKMSVACFLIAHPKETLMWDAC